MTRAAPAALFCLFSLALAGCGDESSEPRNVTRIVVKQDNPYQKQMLALGDVDRMLTLRRAVQDDGGSCAKITGSRYQQEYQGMAMWVAYCSSGSWAVYIAPSSEVQVRSCRDSKTLGLPECVAAPDNPDAPLAWPNAANPLPPPTPAPR